MEGDELAARRARAQRTITESMVGQRVEAASGEVTGDGVASITLRFETGTLTIRSLDADGEPDGSLGVDWEPRPA